MKERRIVFISHANPEENEFASWLGTRLTAAGYKVWTDVLNLVGGEKFWREIGEVIRKEAAVVIVALSHASYRKEGVLNEIAIAEGTGRTLNNTQFIMPILLDNLPFSEFPEQLIRLNAIDFSRNWADGFSMLLVALEDSQVPQSTSDFAEGLVTWQKIRLRQSSSTLESRETVVSNWFQITSLPSQIYFSHFRASQEAMKHAFDTFQIPTAQYGRLAVSFADTSALQKQTPDIPLEQEYCIPLQELLDGQETDGPPVSWLDANNLITYLLHQAWESFAESQGLLPYEFAHGKAMFVPLDLIEGNVAKFKDENGNQRWRRLVGRSEKRRVYWHFAVSGKVSLTVPRHLVLRPHVVFTQNGKIPVDSKNRAARLRKGFCKNWWNDRWRDLVRAFVAFLADGEEEFSLPLGGGTVVTVVASPMGFEAPLSIAEEESVSAAEEDYVEEETAADVLDDCDDELDATELENILQQEDEEQEEGS